MSGRSFVVVALAAVALVAASAAGGVASRSADKAAAVSAGGAHTCAVTTGAGAKCWGAGAAGQLGNGSGKRSLRPVDVSGLGAGVAALSAGGDHTCARTTGGGVKCWGANGFGQLGDGTTTRSLTPVDVSGLAGGVQAVAAGETHTCAVTAGGAVKCWGYNAHGELGDGTTTRRLTPVDVSGLSSGVQAVSAGFSHTCALTSGGGVKCWGYNGDGELGDGTGGTQGQFSTTPVDVVGLGSGVSAISAGGSHTCALLSGGGVECWGYNGLGELGDGMGGEYGQYSNVPVGVSGLSSGATAVSAGGYHTCAALSGGGAKCWGDNISGELGNGGLDDLSNIPVSVHRLSGVSVLSAGSGRSGSHTCAVTSAGGVKCWGSNENGELGDGTRERRDTPVGVIGFGGGTCLVPNVTGKQLAAAKRAIKKAGCRVEVHRDYSSRVKRGHVIYQEPRSGRLVSRGTVVYLLVSKGAIVHCLQPLGRQGGGVVCRLARGSVGALSADGRRVAVIVRGVEYADRILVWRGGGPSTAVDPESHTSCHFNDEEDLAGIALAGGRVAWIGFGYGRVNDETKATDYFSCIGEARVSRPEDIRLGRDFRGRLHLGHLLGDGSLIAFNGRGERLWRLRGTKYVPIGRRSGKLTSVNRGRVAVVRQGTVAVYTAAGKLLRRIHAGASVAKLDGATLVLQKGAVLRPYDVSTGKAGHSRRLHARPGKLVDVAAGLAVYTAGRKVHVLRLADGKDMTAGKGLRADVEPAGLFYAARTRVVFMPMRAVRALFR